MLRGFFLFLFIASCQFTFAHFEEQKRYFSNFDKDNPSTPYLLYLFVYTSEQTQSGAGHISMAFGKDTANLTYYTKYRAHDGGGFKVKNISFSGAFNYDFKILKHQNKTPSLVLKLQAKEPDLDKLEQLSDHWNIEKPWSLFIILTGFGSQYHSLKKLKKFFSDKGYDVYIPNYISRKSLEKTVANLDRFYRQHDLAQYEKVHVFAYIVGSWSINMWLQEHTDSNIKSIVYDRSTLQERAPYILITDLKLPNYLVFGPIMHDLHQTPYTEIRDANIQKGLLLEAYATAIVRKHRATAAALGPYCWDPSCFKQNYLDYKYVPLNHDHMYTHPEVFGEAVLHFFKFGNFGSTLDAIAPVAEPFIKHKP